MGMAEWNIVKISWTWMESFVFIGERKIWNIEEANCQQGEKR